jgi:amidase
MTADLAWGSIREITGEVRSGHVSVVELLEAQLARIERLQPALNAIATLDAGGARLAARAADKALVRGDPVGPLHGIALTIKDSHAVAGVRSTIGVAAAGDRVPAEDGTVAARLRAAGAIILGKTNLASWLYDIQTVSELFGRTNNPWELGRTVGGSSGGSAAAVAAGLSVADVGSDCGGSVRIPASFCGVVGFKPTEGRIPETGHQWTGRPRSHWYMESIGPLARSVEDVERLFSILAGPDGSDWTIPPVPLSLRRPAALRGLRVAICDALPGQPVQAEVRAAVRRVGEILSAEGAIVEPALPVVDWDAQAALRSRLFRFADQAVVADGGGAGDVTEFFESLDQRSRFVRAWTSFFETWDVLLLPSTNRTAFTHRPNHEPQEIDGALVAYWTPERHTQPANLTGGPAISLPAGLDADGLPIGVQLVGDRWQDERLLAIARSVEPIAGGFLRPPVDG